MHSQSVLWKVVLVSLAGALIVGCGDSKKKDSAKEITAFSFQTTNNSNLTADVEGVITGTDIAVTVPNGTDVTALTPTIVITGESVSPNSGVAQDFTNPVKYTVTAEDESTAEYTVTVTVASSSAKEITKFEILDIEGTITGTNIAITVPYGTDVTSLAPTITATGASVSPKSGVPQNFTSPVKYTVTAADGSTKQYTVTVTVAANSAKDITLFKVMGIDGTIDEDDKTISVTVPYGTDVTALTPTINITGASVSPNSEVAQDFTNPVTYTVTAADSTTKTYTVTVHLALNPAKAITAFTVLVDTTNIAGTINETDHTIAITVPYGTAKTSLVPTITITGASVSPNSEVAQDFTNPVTYTVTAADSTTQTYTVTVTVAPSPAKDITAFSVLVGVDSIDGTINETNSTISVTVPYGTNVTALVPTITITGVSVSPDSDVAQDFTTPVTYTVTAADTTTKTYTVTVNVALNPAKDITAFTVRVGTDDIPGTINQANRTIAVTVPYGTNRNGLVPTITHTGASVSPNTGVAQNFTNPVTYTVTAANSTTKTYTVTVTVALNTAKDITAFTVLVGTEDVAGAINETNHTIAITVPYGTDVTALVPSITITGASVSPDSEVAQDFTDPVTYTVTAADTSTKTYSVTVTVDPGVAADITDFSVLVGTEHVPGAINETDHTIAITVPYGTDVTALVPTIVASVGATVDPLSGAAQDFTNPVTYTATSANGGTTTTYTVTVTVAPNTAADITGFTLHIGSDDVPGTIDQDAQTITFDAPYNTDVTALVPTITISAGATVDPLTGVAQDFTNPVTYTVTAEDTTTTKDYVVTVNVAPNTAADITAFTLLVGSENVAGTIDQAAQTITFNLPTGTNVTALVPTITLSDGATVNPDTAVAHDFTTAATYTVTAEDTTTTKDYVVTVNVGPCIKINEVRVRKNANEFVELFNVCDVTQSVEGWDLFVGGTSYPLTGITTIAPHAFAVRTFNNNLNDTAATIQLRDTTTAVIDEMSYGGTSGVTAPGNGQSIGRVPDGADTNVNADDFSLNTPTPGTANVAL